MNDHQTDFREMAFSMLAQVIQAKQRPKRRADPDKYKTRAERESEAVEVLIRAFDALDSYATYYKQKRSGGKRKIQEPHADLKFAQRRLLTWLYRLAWRTEHYRKNYDLKRSVEGRTGLKHFVNFNLHGAVPGRSVGSAVRKLTSDNEHFVIKLDLQDAFPSIKKEVVLSTLEKILLDEFESYFDTYRNRGKKLQWIIETFGLQLPSPRRGRSKQSYNQDYVKFPLFSASQSPDFRRFVRDEVRRSDSFAESELPHLATAVATLLADLVTHEGALPQGAPTSGFMLGIVLSESGVLRKLKLKGIGECSMYVDDLLIKSVKKPDQALVAALCETIEATGFLKINQKKVHVYDMRNQAAPMLGMKLVQRFAETNDLQKLWRQAEYDVAHRGFQARMKSQGRWRVTHMSLSQKLQKKYRAVIHACIVTEPDPSLLAQAHGYIGHLVTVYGWPAPNMPSSVCKTVHAFREKFNIYEKTKK